MKTRFSLPQSAVAGYLKSIIGTPYGSQSEAWASLVGKPIAAENGVANFDRDRFRAALKKRLGQALTSIGGKLPSKGWQHGGNTGEECMVELQRLHAADPKATSAAVFGAVFAAIEDVSSVAPSSVAAVSADDIMSAIGGDNGKGDNGKGDKALARK